MTSSSLTELARQGDPSAIAALMNRTLQPKGITAKAAARHGCLQIQLESAQVPSQAALVKFVTNGLNNLGVRSIQSVRLYGYQAGAEVPAWEEEILLPPVDQDEPTIVEVDEDEAEGAGVSPSFDSHWQDEDVPSPRRRPPLLLPLLAIALLVGIGALAALLWPRLRPQPTPLPTVAVSPPSTPTVAVSTPPSVAASATPFRDAVNKATEAATQTQTATTTEEWQSIVTLWQESIALMQQVPDTDANYSVAQEKIGEYQNYLNYAQQRLDTLQ